MIPEPVPARPVSFNVGDHTLVLTKLAERRWMVAVDMRRLDPTFDTEADAWAAGVRHVFQLGQR